MELQYFLDPITNLNKRDFNDNSYYYIPKNDSEFSVKDYEIAEVVLLGVDNQYNKAPDLIRKSFYKLYNHYPKLKIYDCGNLKPGKNKNDLYSALEQVFEQFVKDKKIILILGGSQALTYNCFKIYQKLGFILNVSVIDSVINMHEAIAINEPDFFINRIITQNKNNLLNFNNIAYQSYLIPKSVLQLCNKLYFDNYRLGEIRNQLSDIEPTLRDSHLVSFDISAIRASDSPGNKNASPNGLYGEEACQLSKYAGISDNVNCFGMFDLDPEFDYRNQSANLIAQIIWYFLDGLSQRKNEIPTEKSSNYEKYLVKFNEYAEEFVFYKSKITNRWWIQFPLSENKKQQIVLSCSYSDYESALNNEIPDKWWRFMQKSF